MLMINTTCKAVIEDYSLFSVTAVDATDCGFPVRQAFVSGKTEKVLKIALSAMENLLDASFNEV